MFPWSSSSPNAQSRLWVHKRGRWVGRQGRTSPHYTLRINGFLQLYFEIKSIQTTNMCITIWILFILIRVHYHLYSWMCSVFQLLVCDALYTKELWANLIRWEVFRHDYPVGFPVRSKSDGINNIIIITKTAYWTGAQQARHIKVACSRSLWAEKQQRSERSEERTQQRELRYVPSSLGNTEFGFARFNAQG